MIDSDDYGSLFHELKNYISFLNSTLQLYELRHEDLINDPQWAETKHISKRILNISNALPLCDLKSNFYPALSNPFSFFGKFLRDFEKKYDEEDFQLSISIEEQLPDIYLDPSQLHMVLMQLISNAYDATNKNGKIFLKAAFRNGMIIITLKDFGCGLPTDNPEEIFEIGYTTKPDALGLGLALARSALSLIDGTITACNNPTCGATFTIQFPAKTKK